MTSFANLISLAIPLGIGLLALFGSLLAHRGFATKGTWTVLISAATYLLSLIVFAIFAFLETSFGSHFDASFIGWINIIALVSMCVGSTLMLFHWNKLSQETQWLETLAHRLAAEREVLEARASASSTGQAMPLPSSTESDSLDS